LAGRIRRRRLRWEAMLMASLIAKASPREMHATGGERPPIDFGAIACMVDLRSLIADDIGPPARVGRWVCPFHADADGPNLSVERSGRRWKCFRCGKAGSALDWLMEREGITIVEAARRFDPLAPGSGSGQRQRRAAPVVPTPALSVPPTRVAWKDPAWQSTVDRVVSDAEDRLWSPPGQDALVRPQG
jgi:hypothetical protein